MTDRLKELFSLIPNCDTFADVGCDHGYISQAVIKSGKAKKVYFSDISSKCLKKAEDLLSSSVNEGVAVPCVSNGFEKLPKVDSALVAGMGGEEIVAIINSAKNLPNTLILQPMKNSEKVRVCLIKNGYKILKDYTFFAGEKFYDVMLCEKGEDFLTEDEILFGRTNLLLKPSAFLRKWQEKKREIEGYLSNDNIGEKSRIELSLELEKISKIC